MKTIGLIGGMSWESTLHYYRLINEGVRARRGGLSSAQLLLYSVDFAPIGEMQKDGRWLEAGAILATAAQALERGGADFLLICANTMHKVAPEVEAAVRIPLLHVVDEVAAAARAAGVGRVGLLGTRFTMEEPFYRERLAERGVDALTPPADERAEIHRIIYEELCLGRVVPASTARLKASAQALVAAGAGGVVLGCTELMLSLGPADVPVPLFDTLALHAAAAVARACNGDAA